MILYDYRIINETTISSSSSAHFSRHRRSFLGRFFVARNVCNSIEFTGLAENENAIVARLRITRERESEKKSKKTVKRGILISIECYGKYCKRFWFTPRQLKDETRSPKFRRPTKKKCALKELTLFPCRSEYLENAQNSE